ncbi:MULTISPECIES: hypothetical protein [Vibrio]|nr:hypothetical protein [Vibrio sp. 2033]MDW2125675.1 hypothetical protein [Vibrio sp. 2033]
MQQGIIDGLIDILLTNDKVLFNSKRLLLIFLIRVTLGIVQVYFSLFVFFLLILTAFVFAIAVRVFSDLGGYL